MPTPAPSLTFAIEKFFLSKFLKLHEYEPVAPSKIFHLIYETGPFTLPIGFPLFTRLTAPHGQYL